jgi:hypothetical protein
MTVVPRDFTRNLRVPTSARRKKRTRLQILRQSVNYFFFFRGGGTVSFLLDLLQPEY